MVRRSFLLRIAAVAMIHPALRWIAPEPEAVYIVGVPGLYTVYVDTSYNFFVGPGRRPLGDPRRHGMVAFP